MSESHVPVFDVLGGVITFRSCGDFFLKTDIFEICQGGELTLHAMPLGKMIYGFMMARKEIRDWCFYFKIVGKNH